MAVRNKTVAYLMRKYPDGTSPLKAVLVVAVCGVLARLLLSLAP